MLEIYDKEYDFPMYTCDSFVIKEIDEFAMHINFINGRDCDNNIVVTSSIPLIKCKNMIIENSIDNY